MEIYNEFLGIFKEFLEVVKCGLSRNFIDFLLKNFKRLSQGIQTFSKTLKRGSFKKYILKNFVNSLRPRIYSPLFSNPSNICAEFLGVFKEFLEVVKRGSPSNMYFLKSSKRLSQGLQTRIFKALFRSSKGNHRKSWPSNLDYKKKKLETLSRPTNFAKEDILRMLENPQRPSSEVFLNIFWKILSILWGPCFILHSLQIL